jgi:hypothetical protein
MSPTAHNAVCHEKMADLMSFRFFCLVGSMASHRMLGVTVLYHFPVTAQVALRCTRQQVVVNDLVLDVLLQVPAEDAQATLSRPPDAHFPSHPMPPHTQNLLCAFFMRGTKYVLPILTHLPARFVLLDVEQLLVSEDPLLDLLGERWPDATPQLRHDEADAVVLFTLHSATQWRSCSAASSCLS